MAIPDRPKAYSYVRMSTDIQLKGDSKRRQVEKSERYAKEHGLDLVSDFELEDIGVSAFRGDNVRRRSRTPVQA
jgi:DNA invertase Pin-like site-specific DNA recombinase